MGMRDWLIIIVIVGIVLILIDGYRRKRKDSIRVKLDKNIPQVDADDDPDIETVGELPNGGARIVPRDEYTNGNDSYSDDENATYEEYEDDEEDEQVVPVLMDAVNLSDKQLAESVKPKSQTDRFAKNEEPENHEAFDADDDYEDEDGFDDSEDVDEFQDEDDSEAEMNEEADEESYEDEENYLDSESDYDDEDYDDEGVSIVRVSHREDKQSGAVLKRGRGDQDRIEPTIGEMDIAADEIIADDPVITSQAAREDSEPEPNLQAELFAESPKDFIPEEDRDESEEDYLEPEEVIVINVMAKQGEMFAGSDLLPILLQQDMRLGKMSIFHKHANKDGNGPVMFSMANMVKPGTFDISQMEEFSTPGVSLFLQLPNVNGNMKSFEQMLETANIIKDNLEGDLKDEHRSVITRQTIEHCRQRIQDFELTQLAKK